MTLPPANPKIFHITHIDNLPKIVEAGCLWSDRRQLAQKVDVNVIGMPTIKRRRLEQIEVACHPLTHVGDYVPFYLCPRSVMLYIYHRNNHPDLPYKGGQDPIIHFQADLNACAKWASQNGTRFAFSNSNAGSFTADFFSKNSELEQIDWDAVNARDFRDRQVQERKQAEFLIFDSFPWSLVEHIGVFNKNKAALAKAAIMSCSHQPTIQVENGWYF